MARVCLVSCVRKKLDRSARAADLYSSAWFLKARAYALRFDRWYIISAKFGLVDPDAEIEPYEMTLNNMPKLERERWGRGVFQSLCEVTDAADAIVVLAGSKYREMLVPPLKARGNCVEVPMEGLTIGKQLQWLMKKTRESV